MAHQSFADTAVQQAASHAIAETVEEAGRDIGRGLGARERVREILIKLPGVGAFNQLPGFIRQLPGQIFAGVLSAALGQIRWLDPQTRSILRHVLPYLADGITSGITDAAKWEKDVDTALDSVISATPDTTKPKALLDAVVISGELPGIHRVDATNPAKIVVLCRTFDEAQHRWNLTHGERKEQKGGGKGQPAAVTITSAKPFPSEIVSFAHGLAIKGHECPDCLGGAVAPAKKEPEKTWEEKIGTLGRWFAAALGAAMEIADRVDEMRKMDPIAWRDLAYRYAYAYLNAHPDPTLHLTPKQKIEARHILALPKKLSEEDAEEVARIIFAHGVGELDIDTQIAEAAKKVAKTLKGVTKVVPKKALVGIGIGAGVVILVLIGLSAWLVSAFLP